MTTAVETVIVPEKVNLPFDLSVMQDEGIFVDVTCTGFSSLWGGLRWGDLGIDAKRVGLDLSSPTCALLPIERARHIRRMSGRAHDTLNSHAYRFLITAALFGTNSWRWLTWRAFEVFEVRFAAVRDDLRVAVYEAIEHYDSILRDMEQRASQLALTSAERLAAGGVSMPATFRDDVIARVMARVPTPEQLLAISVSYRAGALQLGSEMLEEQRLALEARQELQRQQMEQVVISADVQAELAVKNRIREMQIDSARERISAALSPIDEAANHLQAALYEGAQSVLESLQRHERVPPSTARKAREMAEQFRLMAWQEDADLERLLSELRKAATVAEHKGPLNPERLTTLASDVAAMCYDAAREAGTVHRMSALEV